MREIRSPLDGIPSPFGVVSVSGAPAFYPTSLFASSENGAFYDPSDLSTLFQERTGAGATTPAGVGDVVGTILDLSGNGHHATATSDSARPILRQTVGGLYYLEADGVDDNMTATYSATFASPFTRSVAYQTNASGKIILDDVALANQGSFYQTSPTEIRFYAGGVTDTIASGYPIGSPAYLFGEVTGGIGAGNLSVSGSGGSDTGDNGGAYPSGITIMAAGNLKLDLDGRIYGIVDIDRLLTAEERSNLNAWFAAKAGV